jgi:hypothetical protein
VDQSLKAFYERLLTVLRDPIVRDGQWQLLDQLHPASYDWNGDDLLEKGLYLDAAPWQASVYNLSKLD